MAHQAIDHSVLEGDNIAFIENDRIKLGVNLALGGCVTYLAEHGHENLINSFDWGRQVQMSFYSFPVPYQPEGVDMVEDWRTIGWNPIQCGDCFGHRSKVLEYRSTENEVYVKCIPMHWPLDNLPGECTFETWYRLNGDRVDVTARLNNARPDTTLYPARNQELPAVYTNASWFKVLAYLGDKPFTGDALTEVYGRQSGNVWPPEFAYCTEYWMALVDDDNYGLGVYNPSTALVSGGFTGTIGVGGPKDASTGYISPFQMDILDHDIVYTYTYSLIVGDVDTIRERAAQLMAAAPVKPCWSFDGTRDHFYYENITDNGLPKNGCLEFSFAAGGKLCSPVQMLPKGRTRIVLDAAFTGGEVPCTVSMNVCDGKVHDRSFVYPRTEFAGTLQADGVRKEHILDISAAADLFSTEFDITFGGEGSAKIWGIRIE